MHFWILYNGLYCLLLLRAHTCTFAYAFNVNIRRTICQILILNDKIAPVRIDQIGILSQWSVIASIFAHRMCQIRCIIWRICLNKDVVFLSERSKSDIHVLLNILQVFFIILPIYGWSFVEKVDKIAERSLSKATSGSIWESEVHLDIILRLLLKNVQIRR